MLGKLLKYEFRSTAPIFGLTYAALIVLAGINALLMLFESKFSSLLLSTVTTLTIILYILVACAVFVVTLVLIVVRFYRMFGSEGYLWFTLPASANQHLLAKFISAVVWTLASVVVILFSIGLLTIGAGLLDFLGELPGTWQASLAQGIDPLPILICSVILLVVAWFANLFMFYTAIAIGPNLTKSRLGGTVLAYLIIYIINQVVSTFALILIAIPLIKPFETIINTSTALSTTADISNSTALSDSATIMSATNSMMIWLTIGFGILYVAWTVASYFVTRYFMTRKLNLN